tara:strand:+ start:4384 stop:7542 length:3159 start_codon:yes stop_codon:yes gene_type:complete
MLKLEKIFIKNIKSIKESEVNFGDLTVVTGVNSSGKSSLMQSVLYLVQWYGSSEFINNEDEFYVPHLSIYDRYLVNKNRSYEGLKNDTDLPIQLGFKNQNQELKVTFSNSSHTGLRINPENINLLNVESNKSYEFIRFPKVDYNNIDDSFLEEEGAHRDRHNESQDELNKFLQKYFLGNLYFDLIGNSITKDIKITNSDLEPFSLTSIFNYDLDEILEKRNINNEKLNKYLKVKNQFNFSQNTNLSNGILKLSNRNYGDSYTITNSKISNLLSNRYKQEINSSSMVLKETNFFLQFFLSKLPKELLDHTGFGSGIREEEDFFNFSDDLTMKWKNASKKIIFKNFMEDSNLENLNKYISNPLEKVSASTENIFYLFQLFINNLLRKKSIINPLEINKYIDDFIKDLSSSKKSGLDNISRRLVFDAIDELENLLVDINKEQLFNDQGYLAAREEFSDQNFNYKLPSWNDERIKNVDQIKNDISLGKIPYIGVTKDRDGSLIIVDGFSAFKAYEELGIEKIIVNFVEDRFCICNNRAWESDDRDVDLFLDKSKVDNTKTYICPVDSKKIHLGFFSRGEATEHADAQKYGTLFIYPEENKKRHSNYDEPFDFLFDLFNFVDKNSNNEKILKEYFSFYYKDKIIEILDSEISHFKEFISDLRGDVNKKSQNFSDVENIPSYGNEYKKSRKRQKTDDYYDSIQDYESIFNIQSLEEANQLITILRKIKKNITDEQQGTKKSKNSSDKNLKDIFDIKVVLYENSNMHNLSNNVYPNPLSEKDSFLNDLNYLSTIRDPDNQNDPVGNYANILPIGQNAGGLAEYLSLYGEREVESFISPTFTDSGEPLRKYEELSWIQNQSMTLYEAIKLWLKYLGLKDFDFQVINEGTQKRIKFKGGIVPSLYGREITEIGSGIGKILPVIVNCLIAKQGQVVLIEEPETHLHPSAQTYLADFLFAMSVNRQIIIETHSPNIIDRLRFRNIHTSINLLEDEQRPEIEIIFSEIKNNETIFRQGKIDDLGDIIFNNTDDSRPWPVGFFDNTDRDLTNILRARKEKYDNNQ